LLLAAWLLSGCSNKQATATPLDWWHNLEGGVIAGQRPPPPGSNDPYPNISTIPARPPAADVAAQQAIADSLAGQRDSANLAATQDPLKALAPVRPPPKPAAPAAPDPNANKVVVDAASPAPAPPATKPPEPALPSIESVPAVPAAVASGAMPEFAAAPPPPPAGFDLPIVATPAAAPPPAPVKPPAPTNTVVVAFTPQSSTLPPSAPFRLQQFAQAHKGAAVFVTGRGDVVLPSADAQVRALSLGLKRAQSIATFLTTAGVSASNLHLRAEASGSGGTASLLN
jgi:outer membrane protein OmpA-like peptidoglycan-associated protein